MNRDPGLYQAPTRLPAPAYTSVENVLKVKPRSSRAFRPTPRQDRRHHAVEARLMALGVLGG